MLRLPEEAYQEGRALPDGERPPTYLCLLTTEPCDVDDERSSSRTSARVPEEGLLPRERAHVAAVDALVTATWSELPGSSAS